MLVGDSCSLWKPARAPVPYCCSLSHLVSQCLNVLLLVLFFVIWICKIYYKLNMIEKVYMWYYCFKRIKEKKHLCWSSLFSVSSHSSTQKQLHPHSYEKTSTLFSTRSAISVCKETSPSTVNNQQVEQVFHFAAYFAVFCQFDLQFHTHANFELFFCLTADGLHLVRRCRIKPPP